MKKHPLYLIVLLIYLAILPDTSSASHLMGGEINYKHIGNNKYLISVLFYRDCRGISFNNPTAGARIGNNGSATCGSTALTLTRVSITDITPRCSTASKPCSPTNIGGTGEGVEAHLYVDTVDLNSSLYTQYLKNSSCCEVTFYAGQCCRNGAITTGPASNDFFISCTLYLCNLSKCKNKQNSAPAWGDPPNAFMCCNQPYYFSGHAGPDPENDFVYYKIAPALNGLPNASVSYSSPFTYNYPVTPYCVPPTTIKCAPNIDVYPPRGFYFDTSSAVIIFTPTKCDEVAVVAYDMYEYRADSTDKSIIVGRCRRDAEFIVKDDCGYNKPPSISTTNFNLEMCEGDSISSYIKLFDETFYPYQTIPDSISYKVFDGDVPGNKIIVALDTAKYQKDLLFAWRALTGSARPGPHLLKITVTDNHCPKPSISSRTIAIKVKKPITDSAWFTTAKGLCGSIVFSAGNKYISDPSYTWFIADSATGKNICAGNGKAWTSCPLPRKTLKITLSIASNIYCTNYFSWYYQNTQFSPMVTIGNDTMLCAGDSTILKAKVRNATPPYSYVWFKNGKPLFSDTLQQLVIHAISNTKYFATVTDSNKCYIISDTSAITVRPQPIFDLGSNLKKCKDTVHLSAPYDTTWQYNWNTGSTDNLLVVKDNGKYVLNTANKYGCTYKDSVTVVLINRNIFSFQKERAICQKTGNYNLNAYVKVNNKPVSNGVVSYSGTATSNPYFISSFPTGKYPIIFTRDSGKCITTDTMFIRILDKPIANFTSSPALKAELKNATFQMINLTTYGGTDSVHYLWNFGRWINDTSTIKNPNVTYGNIGQYAISLIATSDSGCSAKADQTADIMARTSFPGRPDVKITNTLIVLADNIATVNLQLRDATGRLVFQNNENTGLAKYKDLLKPGVYFYTVMVQLATQEKLQLTGKYLEE